MTAKKLLKHSSTVRSNFFVTEFWLLERYLGTLWYAGDIKVEYVFSIPSRFTIGNVGFISMVGFQLKSLPDKEQRHFLDFERVIIQFMFLILTKCITAIKCQMEQDEIDIAIVTSPT